jgi:hypothetical protein
MSIFWIFFFIIVLCIYILLGLYATEGITQLSTLIFTWIIYTCLWLTFANVFILAYFWATIRKKTGPTGIRGQGGEDGKQGIEGSCSITSSQALVMQQLNTYLDELYKAKAGTSILNQETQRFPCTYLNNKISTQAGSRQFNSIVATLSNQNKPVSDIINYIKSIWKIWFDLLYDGNASWFTDEYADEDYSWTDSNPFDEIKKYDIYYWGITRSFRPLKAEICRSTPNYESAKLPIKPQARLKIIQSNDYVNIADDWHSGGSPDGAWWRAKTVTLGSDTYYPVGDIIGAAGGRSTYHMGHNKIITGDMQYDARSPGPDMRSILVAGDVKDPISYESVWIGGNNWLQTERPVCPEGYTSMGDRMNAWGGGWNSGSTNAKHPIKCVPTDCLQDNGRGADYPNRGGYTVYGNQVGFNVLNHFNWGNNDASGDNGYNTFRANWNDKWYRIKEKCLSPPSAPSTKDPEPQFSDLGIGWIGHPYKNDPKYSIFTFLNLVPEGMIVHKATGRRFYIIHYGGEEVNIYNVLDYSPTTDKFDNGLQVNSNGLRAKVESRTLSRKDERQQWNIILQTDKRFMKLKNVMNSKYLYMGLEPMQGDAQFSTIDLDFDNYKTNSLFPLMSPEQITDNTTFSFISTFGTQMDIIDNAKKMPSAVSGNRIRICSQAKQALNIFGIFVYNDAGALITIKSNNATSSSIYQGHTADKSLIIANENSSRNINQAINGNSLLSKYPGWNNWNDNGSYCSSTNNDGTASTGGDWLEYTLSSVVNIAAIEIIGRIDCCPERFQNMVIQIFNDSKYPAKKSDPVWDANTGTDPNKLALEVFVIEKNGVIHHH